MALSNLLNQYPPVLSVKQVAEILAVSQNTAYAIVRSKQIHSIRVGRSYQSRGFYIAPYQNQQTTAGNSPCPCFTW